MNKTSPRVFAAALALILALPVFSATREATSPKTDAAFEAVDGAHREFDGFPALSLTFSRPLDARKDYG
ncbi:MAG: hypothetical protein LBI59_05400, partial [Candidatus Accumulibacter sp.]|nr:hypothetical protein [Accumulibacter sp.]